MMLTFAYWYLAMGLVLLAHIATTDKGLRQDMAEALATTVGGLFVVLVWPFAMAFKQYKDTQRKRGNAAKTLRRQSSTYYGLFGHGRYIAPARQAELIDRWWNAEDLKGF